MNRPLTDTTAAPEKLDTGLRALCAIAGFYRIPADPDQLAAELALQARSADATDLVRAAQRLGLKAKIVTSLGPERLAKMAAPAILRLTTGEFVIFAGQNAAGRWRIIDPLTRAERTFEAEVLCAEILPEAVLIGRKVGGRGIDPRSFGFRWFLPSLWRYRKPLAHVLIASFFIQIFALVTPSPRLRTWSCMLRRRAPCRPSRSPRSGRCSCPQTRSCASSRKGPSSRSNATCPTRISASSRSGRRR
jgi:subfamily B ATP-binding cassette protein HlyB/CyaB